MMLYLNKYNINDLLRGDIMITLPNDSAVDVRILEQLLELDNLTTSYKLYWFLGIYKEIIEGNNEINYRRIINRMISSAWYPLLQ